MSPHLVLQPRRGQPCPDEERPAARLPCGLGASVRQPQDGAGLRVPRATGQFGQQPLEFVHPDAAGQPCVGHGERPVEGQRPGEIDDGAGQPGDGERTPGVHVGGRERLAALEQVAGDMAAAALPRHVDARQEPARHGQTVQHRRARVAHHGAGLQQRRRRRDEQAMLGLGRQVTGRPVGAAAHPNQFAAGDPRAQVVGRRARRQKIAGRDDALVHRTTPPDLDPVEPISQPICGQLLGSCQSDSVMPAIPPGPARGEQSRAQASSTSSQPPAARRARPAASSRRR